MREFWLLLKIARAKWSWLLLGLLCALITLLANIALLTVAAWFLASMALAGISGVFFNYFFPAAVIRTLAILRCGGRYAERLLTHDATLRLLGELRVDFFTRLVPLAPAGLSKLHSADLFSRLRADIDILDNFYLRLLLPASAAMLIVLGGVIFLWNFDPYLALAVAIWWLLAGAGLPLLCLRLGAAAGAAQVEVASRLRCLLVDGLQGREELLVYDAENRHRHLIATENRQLNYHQSRSARLDSFSQGAVGLIAGMAMWSVLLLGIPLVTDGSWAPTTLPMLAIFALASFEAIQPLPAAWRMWAQIKAAANRILDLTEAQPAVLEPKSEPEWQLASSLALEPEPAPRWTAPDLLTRCDLDIKGLVFYYPNQAEPVLSGVNLALPQGRRVGIVGVAGSGKTTLQQVLLRFWEYQQGQILMDGRDLRGYSGEEIRAKMAVVSQQVFLFNASIAENLRLANPWATEAQLLKAADTARLADFILSLPKGLHSQVGQFGAKLSGGQARRLAVARALLKNAPVLLLDEPTEGLDPLTEAEFWQSLKTVMEGRTVLLITHRSAGLEYMDEVFKLERGRLLSSRGLERSPLDN